MARVCWCLAMARAAASNVQSEATSEDRVPCHAMVLVTFAWGSASHDCNVQV